MCLFTQWLSGFWSEFLPAQFEIWLTVFTLDALRYLIGA